MQLVLCDNHVTHTHHHMMLTAGSSDHLQARERDSSQARGQTAVGVVTAEVARGFRHLGVGRDRLVGVASGPVGLHRHFSSLLPSQLLGQASQGQGQWQQHDKWSGHVH